MIPRGKQAFGCNSSNIVEPAVRTAIRVSSVVALGTRAKICWIGVSNVRAGLAQGLNVVSSLLVCGIGEMSKEPLAPNYNRPNHLTEIAARRAHGKSEESNLSACPPAASDGSQEVAKVRVECP